MSKVDKFGRSFRGGNLVRGSKPGPKGDGFLLDGDGNYLVSNKRIRQLQDPEDVTDAVNRRWSEAKLNQIQENCREAMSRGEMGTLRQCCIGEGNGELVDDVAT